MNINQIKLWMRSSFIGLLVFTVLAGIFLVNMWNTGEFAGILEVQKYFAERSDGSTAFECETDCFTEQKIPVTADGEFEFTAIAGNNDNISVNGVYMLVTEKGNSINYNQLAGNFEIQDFQAKEFKATEDVLVVGTNSNIYGKISDGSSYVIAKKVKRPHKQERNTFLGNVVIVLFILWIVLLCGGWYFAAKLVNNLKNSKHI